MRPVVQMNLDGKEISEYESVAEPSRQTDIS